MQHQNKSLTTFSVFILIMFFVTSCASNYKATFDEAVIQKEAGKYGSAYKKFASLCKRSDSDSESCLEAEMLGDYIVTSGIKNIVNMMDADTVDGFLPIQKIDKLRGDASSYLNFGFDDYVVELVDKLNDESVKTRGYIEEVTDEVEALINEGEVVDAFYYYANLVSLDSTKESNFNRRKVEVANVLMEKASFLGEDNKWFEAYSIYEELSHFDVEIEGFDEIFIVAEASNTLSYYLEKAEVKIAEYDYAGALSLYEYALIYENESESSLLGSLVLTINAKLVEDAFVRAFEHKRESELFKSYYAILDARILLREIPLKQRRRVKVPYSKIISFAERFYNLSLKEEDKYNKYAYLMASYNLNPVIEEVREEFIILNESLYYEGVKNISLEDFVFNGAGEDNSSAGSIFASALSKYIFTNLSGDVALVDNSNRVMGEGRVDSFLSNVEDDEEPKDPLTVNVDLYLTGKILKREVNVFETDSTNVVRVKTGEKELDNPKYKVWLKKNRRALKKGKDVKGRPSPTYKEDILEDIKIVTTTIVKSVQMKVAYNVLDLDMRVIHIDELEANVTVSGKSVDGVTVGSYNKPAVVAQLKPDLDLLSNIEEQLVVKVGKSIYEYFSNVDDDYYLKGKTLFDNGNFSESLPFLLNAKIIRSEKGKDEGDISVMVAHVMDNIITENIRKQAEEKALKKKSKKKKNRKK